MLVINFKTYPQAIGPNALELTRSLLDAAKTYPNVTVGFAPSPAELAEVASHVDGQIWAQHVDPIPAGQQTGFLSPADAKAAGATGTFLNHSEHPLNIEEIKKGLDLAHQVGLKILIFARSPEQVKVFRDLSPDFIAYEPPELIGRTISVSTAKPEVIKEAVAQSGNIPLLVGAGIHEKSDITSALALGAEGAVVSSAIVTAQDPKAIFLKLLSGFESQPPA